MACVCAAGLGGELLRARRAGTERSQDTRESVLPALPVLGSCPDGRARDRRNCDSQPSRHHGSVLVGESGHPAWPVAAACNPAYLRVSSRPDLYPAHQYAAVHQRDSAGVDVPFVKRAGIGLWYRRDRHHGGHGDDGFCCDLESLEMVALRGRGADCAIPVS